MHARFDQRADALSLPPTTDVGDLPISLSGEWGVEEDGRTGIIRLRASTPENANLLYIFDIEVGMLVSVIPGQENLSVEEYARDIGPATLFPFLREAVAGITMRGRFGPIWLRPMNFIAATTAKEQMAAQITAGSEP
ncbi:MAG: protein-export chaperone SecB [Gemmatimonadaceae bacterium]